MLIELTSIVRVFNHTKYINQKYMIQPTLINLHPTEYSQELRYYPFSVNLHSCTGSCNTLDNLSNNVCIPNETEDLNLLGFNMITGINKSRKLPNHAHVNVRLTVENIT